MVRVLGDKSFLEEESFEIGNGKGLDGFSEVGLTKFCVNDLVDLPVENFVFVFKLKSCVRDFFFYIVNVLLYLFLVETIDVRKIPILILCRILVEILHDKKKL